MKGIYDGLVGTCFTLIRTKDDFFLHKNKGWFGFQKVNIFNDAFFGRKYGGSPSTKIL